jgi:hypothetical protein
LFPSGSPEVIPFNFYEPRSFEFLAELPPPIVLFTSHAVEQLPSSAPLLCALGRYRRQLYRVVHFEPIYERQDRSLIGLLRRRYCELNDYNRDLLDLIRAEPCHRLHSVERNVFGLNPLNVTSVIEWGFAE